LHFKTAKEKIFTQALDGTANITKKKLFSDHINTEISWLNIQIYQDLVLS